MITDEAMSWPVENHEVKATGAISNFVNDQVRTPDGELIERQYLSHPGAVAIVAWDEEADAVCVIRQYRHPVSMQLVEIPAGLLDADGETWLDAAARELAEEVGLAASRWQVLVDVCTTPSASEESLRIYLARGTRSVPRPSGFVLEGEEAHMSWSWVSREELTDSIFAGRCQSPSLVTGVLALEAAIRAGRIDSLREPNAPWPIRALTRR